VYGGAEAQISIEDLSLLSGWLPPRVLGMVVEWATRHQDELRAVWRKATKLESLEKIEPLT
jgi:hypothetical protein